MNIFPVILGLSVITWLIINDNTMVIMPKAIYHFDKLSLDNA